MQYIHMSQLPECWNALEKCNFVTKHIEFVVYASRSSCGLIAWETFLKCTFSKYKEEDDHTGWVSFPTTYWESESLYKERPKKGKSCGQSWCMWLEQTHTASLVFTLHEVSTIYLMSDSYYINNKLFSQFNLQKY